MTGRARGDGWPVEPGGAAGEFTREHVMQERKALGRFLAMHREAAGLTQMDLARRVAYSRSSVANVEIGGRDIARDFWRGADRELGAAGALLARFDHLDRMVRAQRPAAAHPPCGCGLTVARWTGRETRALREASRMSVRAFAEFLGVTRSTVTAWESHAGAAPLRLATQAVLDRALTLADATTRTRFAVLVHAPHASAEAVADDAGAVARGSVTSLRRPERTRAAS